MAKNGLYANLHAKQERIAHGSGERMRKAGDKGAPTAKAFKESAKTEMKKVALLSLSKEVRSYQFLKVLVLQPKDVRNTIGKRGLI